MSQNTNQENEEDTNYSPSLNNGIFGTYLTETDQSDNVYLPSLNSGIFGSYYTQPQTDYLPSLNNGIFGSYTYTAPTDTYRLVDVEEHEERKEMEQNIEEELEIQVQKTIKAVSTDTNTNQIEETEETKEEENYYKPVPHYELPPAKSIATEYREIYKQYTEIQFDDTKPIQALDNDVKQVFDGFKKYARQTGKTFVKIEEDIDFNKSGISNTIGLDIDVKSFNKNKFIRQYCELYGLHESQVNIIDVKAGSCIVDVYISSNGKYKVDLNKLSESLNDPKTLEKVKEMKAFCILFNKPSFNKVASFANVSITKFDNRKAYFNSAYDRIYGPGNITWDGDLQDGKNRGGRPYYCPSGWYKRAVSYKVFTAIDFDKKFAGWPIAYHGTKFEYGMSMLLSGFLPSGGGNHGAGVYVTPSIIYAAHPRYAAPKKIPESAKEGLKVFGEGDWIQFAFQVRVDPNSSIKWDMPETFYVGDKKIDPNFKNSEVEWIINSPLFQDPERDDCSIYIVGLMIRVTKEHPRNLTESKWYN